MMNPNILPVEFKDHVPYRHRQYLEECYYRYFIDHILSAFSDDIQNILAEWVSYGNNPFTSNRFGLYDTENQKYLDFLSGERKACQLIQIMFGERPCADCTYNQYQEPSPRPGSIQLSVEHTEEVQKAIKVIRPGMRKLFER